MQRARPASLFSNAIIILLSSGHWSAARAEPSAPPESEIIVTPVLTEPLDPTRTTVYCPTFQAAWNALCQDVLKSELHMQAEPPLVGLLNAGRDIKVMLPDKHFYAGAGKGPPAIAKINGELRKRFKKNAPKLEEKLGPEDLIAYVYLQRDLPFETVFEPNEAFEFHAGDKKTHVEAFGIPGSKPRLEKKLEKLRSQMWIWQYYDETSFIVILHPTDHDEEIVLARVQPRETLEATVAWVRREIDSIDYDEPPMLEEGEVFWAPAIRLSVTHSFDELTKKPLTTPKFDDGYYIKTAMQFIEFQLDKAGASVKSEARLVVPRSAPPKKQRRLIFDRPFLIYVTHKEAEPYLVAWIGDTAALVHSKP